MATKENAEKILENLSQGERIELLRRLIQGAGEGEEEELTTEERIERLEDAVLGSSPSDYSKRVIVRHVRGDRQDLGNFCGCSCCL